MHSRSATLDLVGASLSVLCALHCLATPILLGAAPFLFTEGFEAVLAGILFSVAAVALGLGAARHRRFEALGLFALGVLLFVGAPGAEGSALEIATAVTVSALLVTAHVLNLRFGAEAATCAC